MKRNERLSRKARYGILAAIMAGAFSIMPAAQAMPTGGASGTATITTTGNTMEIASSVTNNLLTWQDFSIAKGETVNFGGSNTYLNVVTGSSASEIYGAITGSAANVYLINPNGILFGDGAQVNVGSLHLSTADITSSLTNFDTAMNALNGADSFSGDIVNKGTLKAKQEITVDGNNITFKNTADVSATSVELTAKNNGEIHIGSADGATPDYTMNGTSYMYKLVSTAEDLQNINYNLSGNYMLAGDITLTAPDNTETGSNFTPIGGPHWNVNAEKFTGRFDGLNYTINNLYIYMNTTDSAVSAGLFTAIGRSGVVENLTLGTGKSTLITDKNGYNGSFAGLNDGILRNVVNNGVAVTGSNYSSGGIVGYNCRLIDGATNKAAVTTKVSYSLGGIVGENDGQGERTGIIRNSLNTGAVTNADSSKVGGIAGNSLEGTLENVGNSGDITGLRNVGGIAGYSEQNSSISVAYNTGNVTSTATSGNSNAGGIVGYNLGTIDKVYNSGNVTGGDTGVAGIAGAISNGGSNDGKITNAYNTGTITGWDYVGGIIGNDWLSEHRDVAENVYNTGNIVNSAGNEYHGRWPSNHIAAAINGTTQVASRGIAKNSFYTQGGNLGGGTFVSEADMKKAATFSSWGDAITADGSNSSAVWRIYEGKTMPLLTAFLTPLTLADTTATYDKQAHSITSLAGVDSTKILGGEIASHSNAGTYAYNGLKGLYSDQQGYNIKAAGDSATLTINKAPLTMTFEPIQKVYDGTTSATAGKGTLTGMYTGDSVSYDENAVTAVYDGAEVGSHTVTYSGITLTGTDADNYSVAEATGTGRIMSTLMPAGGASGTATITTEGNTMYIASPVTNNLITWQDFSLASGRTVNFQGANTYLNVVTGNNESQIYGTLTGPEAKVYILNPNGMLFGDGASVNVSSLHLSTANLQDFKDSLDNFDTAVSALEKVSYYKGAIVNKGALTAAKEITAVGENITIKNTADVNAPQVTLTSAAGGEIHVGSTDGTTPASYALNGTSYKYKLVSTAEDLQNINNNLSGNYMLAGDITLTAPNNTATGSNFKPIAGGTYHANPNFEGRFDGLNYSINNLYINVTDNTSHIAVGLFGTIGTSGVVENLILGTGKSTLNGNQSQSFNGSFVGFINKGILRNVVNQGVEVAGSTRSSGGIAGLNNGLIDGAINKAAVYVSTNSATGGLGGITGDNWQGTIKNSANSGNVTSSSNRIGGIAGQSEDTGAIISNVSNSGTVTGSQNVGGIAGLNNNEISNAANTGTVQGKKWVGGVIGYNNQGTLTNAYNIGSISISNPAGPYGIGGAGGVVGANEGIVTNVYNEGTVSGSNINGGVVGLNGSNTNGYGVLRNAYNTGTVSGTGANTGGIVGLLVENNPDATANGRAYTTGSVENVYNTGKVTSTKPENSLGAIVGQQKGGTISGAYYLCNLTTGVGAEAGGSRSTTQVDNEVAMKQATTFADFSIDKDGSNSSAVWRIYEGKTMPLLTAFLTPLTLADTTVVYDGQAHSVASLSKVDSSKILGGTLSSYTNSGTYTYTGLKELYSDQQGYNIKTSGDTATLTINKAPLTFGVSGYTKTYDGTTTATGGNYIVTNGLVVGGAGYIDVNIAYSDKNVGTDKAMMVSGMEDNYVVAATAESKGTITAASLTVSFADTNKQYDSTTRATAGKGTLTGIIGEDDVTYAADVTAEYDSKNVGDRTVNYSGITLTGADAGNYSIESTAQGQGTITAAPLTVSFADTDKAYDGTTNAIAGQGTLANVFAGDDVSYDNAKLNAVYDSKNAGSRTVNYSGITLTGADAGNYSIESTAQGQGTISKKALTMTAESFERVYDGTNLATGEAKLEGVVAGDDFGARVVGMFDNNDVNAGANKPVTYTAIDIHGEDAVNYDLTKSYHSTGTITPAPLTITFADTNKQYDGTTNAVAGQGTLKGVLGEDHVSYAADVTAVYDSKNVGNRTVNYSGITLTGADAGNYSIKAAAEGKGTITAAPLTITFADTDKQYDGTTNAVAGQGTLNGVLGEDHVSYAADVTAVYDSKNAGSRTVNYSGITLTGADAGNYSIKAAAEGKGTITAAPLTLLAADITKEYDGTTEAPNASYSITNGQLFGEDTITGGSFAYEDKSVGTGKTVTLTGVSVSDGNEGQNYTLTIVNSTNSAITANAPTAVVSVMADRLEAAGTSLPKMEEVIAVAAPAPAATVPTPAAIEPAAPAPAVQSEDEQQSDNVETAATTATTHGDDHANAPAREKPVHNALGKDGVLTMVNEGVNPPESMSAETVAQQNKNTNGNSKEGE